MNGHRLTLIKLISSYVYIRISLHIPLDSILTAMLNIDNNSPQNFFLFSIRVVEYNAGQLNALGKVSSS